MTNKDDCAESDTHRVLAWWDLDVYIGTFRKRKVTARPLRELERVLGHRLHAESWMRYDNMPEDVWKFEAFSYLDTADPALAAYAILKQISQLSYWFGMSWQGYNTAASTSDDPDEATICAFYWNPPDQFGMPHYQSSGVLLQLIDMSTKPFDQRDRHNRLARPVVGVPAVPKSRADYSVVFTVHIICGNKQDLLSFHWPRFQKSRFPGGVTHFEVDARTHAGKPNIIRVSQVLHGVRECDAIAYCLAYGQSFRIKLDTHRDFHFAGERRISKDYSDGIVAFDMTRALG
jgi:hypothetical protein